MPTAAAEAAYRRSATVWSGDCSRANKMAAPQFADCADYDQFPGT